MFIGKWQHVKDTTEIGEGKMFSPGNLRATFDNPDYAKVYYHFSYFCLQFLISVLECVFVQIAFLTKMKFRVLTLDS